VLGTAVDRSPPGTVLTAIAIALLSLPLAPEGVGALGALEHPSIEQSAAGVRGILFYTLSPIGTMAAASLAVEVSELALYGISGLSVSGVRIGTRKGPVALVGEAARLDADVGHETRLALTPTVFWSNRWAASLGVVYESAVVDGMAPARLVSATGQSLVKLSGAVSVGGGVARYRGRGETSDGADVTLAVLVRPVTGAIIRAVVDVGRWTGAQPTVSTTVGSLSPLRLTLGYDAATEALKGALAVGLGGLSCAVGAHHHPTLGPRYGVTLLWGW
jgi:hypothetical protein